MPSAPPSDFSQIAARVFSAAAVFRPVSSATATDTSPNNSRAVRHVNPWKTPTVYRAYPEYEDEFRERMEEAGIPVDTPSGGQ